MMDDKELLELAAKAAGICLHPKESLKHSYGNWGCDTTCGICKKEPCAAPFDPFRNDGEAFRLASKLNLVVEFGNNMVVHPVEIGGEGTDPLAATRRAIVQAAAYIGMKMP